MRENGREGLMWGRTGWERSGRGWEKHGETETGWEKCGLGGVSGREGKKVSS